MAETISTGTTVSERSAWATGRTRVSILVAAAAVAAVLAVALWAYWGGRESTDDAQVDGHIVPIAARVGGTVLAVHVKDNQDVGAGAPLVDIDPRDLQVALARAAADLAEAEATAQAARTTVPMMSTTTSSQVAAAASDLETARARTAAAEAHERETRANETKALGDLERLRALVAKDEVSRQEFDAAVAAAESSRAAVQSAQAAVVEAQKGIESAAARLAQARTAPQQVDIMQARASSADAKVAQSKAALDQAQLNLEYASVRAPVEGVVSRKGVEVGQVVQAGQPLMAIVPLADVWVTANFKESQLGRMRPGQAVTITVDAFGGRSFRGRVESIAAATGARFSMLPPENATGNYVKVVQRVPVKIALEPGQDPEHLLRPGMSVVPSVLTR